MIASRPWFSILRRSAKPPRLSPSGVAACTQSVVPSLGWGSERITGVSPVIEDHDVLLYHFELPVDLAHQGRNFPLRTCAGLGLRDLLGFPKPVKPDE